MSTPHSSKTKRKNKRTSLPHVGVDLEAGVAVREKEKRSKRGVATRSFRSAKEFIYNSSSDKDKNVKEDLETTKSNSPFVIRAVRENTRSPRNRSRSTNPKIKIGHKKTPYDTYSRITSNIFNAMELDEETQKNLFSIIKKSSGMKKIKQQNVMSQAGKTAFENIEIDIKLTRIDQKSHTAALLIQSCYRSHLARKKFVSNIAEYQQAKIQSFHDLCTKEKDFVMSLATLVSQYIVPLRTTQDKHLKKTYDNLSDVFESVENILGVHRTLLKTLYELPRESWPHLKGLGQVFTYIAPHWKIYGTYVHKFKFSLCFLEDSLDNNEHLREFVERKQQSSSLDLTMLLSLPLNHISGYSGHLKRIQELTPEDSPEHCSLLQAISITSETANFIGNSLAHAENLATIHRLRGQISVSADAESLFLELEQSNAKFVMEVSVDFIPPGSKKNHQGTLFIFDTICFAISQKGNSLKKVYHLKELSVEKNAQGNGFALFIIDEEKPSYNCVIEGIYISIILIAIVILNFIFCFVGTRTAFTLDPPDKCDFVVQNIQNLIAHNQLNRTFGVPIEVLIERDKQEDGIPIVLKDMVTFIEKEGIDTVGLFRVPGTATAIKKAKTIFNQCEGKLNNA